jgi:acetyl-CoA carboxylase biotin carboxyl carrier protein
MENCRIQAGGGVMGFSMDDVMQALQIVKECKDVEVHIDSGDLKLSIFKGDVGESPRSSLDLSRPVCHDPRPEQKAAPSEPKPEGKAVPVLTAAKPVEFETEGLVAITANVTSVFYRRPSPDEPPFVEVGSEVREDTVLCLLEVMKCFRQVTADVRGRVERICAESNSLVENGTVLFLIRPL